MIHVEDMADAKADADEENEDGEDMADAKADADEENGDSVLEESPESKLDRTVNSAPTYYPRLAFDLTDGRALGKQSGIVSPRELYLEAVYGLYTSGSVRA